MKKRAIIKPLEGVTLGQRQGRFPEESAHHLKDEGKRGNKPVEPDAG